MVPYAGVALGGSVAQPCVGVVVVIDSYVFYMVPYAGNTARFGLQPLRERRGAFVSCVFYMVPYAGNTPRSMRNPCAGVVVSIVPYVIHMAPYAGSTSGSDGQPLRERRRQHRFLGALHGALCW